MAAEKPEPNATRPTGLFDPIKSLLEKFLGLIHTRLDLVATELEEERERLKDMILIGFLSLFCLILGVVFLTLFIIVIFWETHRFYVLGGFALLYLCLGAALAYIARRKAISRPKFLSATLSELAKDRDQLKS